MTKFALFIFAAVAVMAGSITTAAQTTSPAYFGMHETNPHRNGWPSVGFKTLRTWNTYPAVSWKDLNPSRGVYKWENLDSLVSLSQSRGVDLLYTFGRTPTWASSNPNGACKNTGAGSCYPPANQQDWKNFVSAISSRYAGKIKYWETWNEANAANSWSGTSDQMLTMARDAYPIIKASSSSAVVLAPGPQGSSAYRWLDDYLSAGGGSFADGFAFHGYLGFTNGVSNPPEKIVSLVNNIKSVLNSHGQGSKPLWDTEHGWGPNSSLPNEDQQAAWLSRHLILSWSSGVTRSIWYLWDSDDQGTLWDKAKKMHKPGTAYGELYKWLVGSSQSEPCSVASDSTTWTCSLSRSQGQQAQIIWKSSGTAAETVPGQFTQYSDLAGNTSAVPASRSVTIGPKPIMLFTESTGGKTPPNAVLSVNPLSGNVPLTVTADSSGSADNDGSIVSRSINFGDGTVVSGTTATHTYNTAGSFTITLSVKDDAGLSDSDSKTAVASNGSMTVSVSPTSATIQSGATQQFTATVQNNPNHAVAWSASGGSITSSGLFTAPKVSANTAVTVTATSSADHSKTGVAHLTISADASSTAKLTNPGFELGTTGWSADSVNGGSVKVLTNSAAAHSGSKYAEAKSGASEFISYFAAGSNGRPQYIPVKPGQVVTFGGWVNRISGDGYARWKIQLSDASKGNITHVSPGSGTVNGKGWTWMQRSITVPQGKAFVRFELQIFDSKAPTIVHFDDALLQIK